MKPVLVQHQTPVLLGCYGHGKGSSSVTGVYGDRHPSGGADPGWRWEWYNGGPPGLAAGTGKGVHGPQTGNETARIQPSLRSR